MISPIYGNGLLKAINIKFVKDDPNNYLSKKTKRSENKEIHKKESYKPQKSELNNHLKSEPFKIHQHQTKIKDFFEDKKSKIIQPNNKNINYQENINTNSSDVFKEKQRIFIQNRAITNNVKINDEKEKISINNPFQKFFTLLKDEQNKQKYDYLKEKGILNDSEISQTQKIIDEFRKETKDSLSENDKLIKISNYFLSKGFNEEIRKSIYRCLINYGIPNLESFNIFYKNLSLEISQKKLNIPEKMCVELYIEYINNIMKKNNSNSFAKNSYISEFFFSGENFFIVKNNFSLINYFKKNSKNLEYCIQKYLDTNFDNLFCNADFQINKNFRKSKFVLIKILSNIVSKCDKIGYLNYKNIINDKGVIFDGLKIKGNCLKNKTLEEMIALKIFGIELTEVEFKHILIDYFLLLFSNFHPEK